MTLSEASGKHKASDDNALNSNAAPKTKRTRKDASSPVLLVYRVLNVMSRNVTHKHKRTRLAVHTSTILSC